MSKSTKNNKVVKVKGWAVFRHNKFYLTLFKDPAKNKFINLTNKERKIYTWTPCEITYQVAPELNKE